MKLNNKGSILIFTLWIVALLTVFAVQIGLRIRQRATLLKRIEVSSDLRHIAAAGIKKALSTLKKEFERNNQIYSAEGKIIRHDNPADFSSIILGRGQARVFYSDDASSEAKGYKFGFTDEERKLNINTADQTELAVLIEDVAQISSDEARDVANAIVSWREPGELELEGFYSDNYYTELAYPYETKDMPFEVLDELLLLKGVTPEIFESVKPYLTVYGTGKININTATVPVLKALGLSDNIADKVDAVRRGPDGVAYSADDYIFYKTFDIASEMKVYVDLNDAEVDAVDQLNALKKIATNSYYFMIHSRAEIPGTQYSTDVECAYNLRENKIEYWREK